MEAQNSWSCNLDQVSSDLDPESFYLILVGFNSSLQQQGVDRSV